MLEKDGSRGQHNPPYAFLMLREAKRRGFVKIITYTLEVEAGVSLRAVGWDREERIRARSPVRYTRALPSVTKGSAIKRSAVRSGRLA